MKFNIIALSFIFNFIYFHSFVINSYDMSNKKELEKDELKKFNDLEINTNRIKRKVVGGRSLKWNFPIYYRAVYPVSYRLVNAALRSISRETCITFESRMNLPPNTPGIIYGFTGNCKSFVGRRVANFWQGIEIGKACNSTGGILHETLHSLGIFHEHCRYDSHKYITLYPQNMIPSGEIDFRMVCFSDSNTYFLNYDYGSIMHYGSHFYSRNFLRTIVPTDPNYSRTIGQSEKLSFIDIQTLNFRYCSSVCTQKIRCYNGGYQDPKNCGICKCIEGFRGNFCEYYSKTKKYCKKTEIILKNRVVKLLLIGKKYCIFHVKTSHNRRITINVLKAFMYPNTQWYCSYKNTLEINYQKDKSVTGARFCTCDKGIKFMSHDNYVIIYYRSDNPGNSAYLYLRTIEYNRKPFNEQKRRRHISV